VLHGGVSMSIRIHRRIWTVCFRRLEMNWTKFLNYTEIRMVFDPCHVALPK
jgi:hypothetical protein